MSKKKTPKKSQPTHVTVSNCTFTGTQWDTNAVEVLATVADSLYENSRATCKFIELFRAQGVECLLSIGAQNEKGEE